MESALEKLCAAHRQQQGNMEDLYLADKMIAAAKDEAFVLENKGYKKAMLEAHDLCISQSSIEGIAQNCARLILREMEPKCLAPQHEIPAMEYYKGPGGPCPQCKRDDPVRSPFNGHCMECGAPPPKFTRCICPGCRIEVQFFGEQWECPCGEVVKASEDQNVGQWICAGCKQNQTSDHVKYFCRENDEIAQGPFCMECGYRWQPSFMAKMVKTSKTESGVLTTWIG